LITAHGLHCHHLDVSDVSLGSLLRMWSKIEGWVLLELLVRRDGRYLS
jgi:hypothetical protein